MAENEISNAPGANDASNENAILKSSLSSADLKAVSDSAPSELNAGLHQAESPEETKLLQEQMSSYLRDVSNGTAVPDFELNKYPALKAYREQLESSVFKPDGSLQDSPNLKAAEALVDLNNAQISATRQGMSNLITKMGNVSDTASYGGDSQLRNAVENSAVRL